MGLYTVGIAQGKDPERLTRPIGAAVNIHSQAQDPSAELQKLSGAKVILGTEARIPNIPGLTWQKSAPKSISSLAGLLFVGNGMSVSLARIRR